MKRLLLLLSAITCLPIAVSAQTYSITNTGASSQWCKIGTFTPVLTGATIRIKAYVHNGYNASNSQDALIEILFKNSNGASVNEYGFAGNSMYSIFGASSHSYEVKWLANAGGNSATAYDLYIYFPWYTYNSQYTVSIGEVSSWTNICSIGQSDPGNNSSTVLIAEHSFNILHTNVGIGTTMPLVKLQLQGSSTTGTVETEEIFKIGRALTEGVSFQQAASFKLGRWAVPGGSYESYTRLDIALKGNNASSDYNTDVTVLTMQNNGNIGIGTVTPNDKFSVYNRFLINHDGVAKWGGSADYGFLSWDNGRAMIGGQTGQGLALYTDNSEKIRILTNGNVGIGTTNPQNTLDVNGIIRAREIKATLEGWSDFVFDDGYKLPSLSEVENYIKANRQLLDIPSTKDISKDGVNLGEMQTKLLQKIEELTLYAIEQNRRIELLEQEIENLNRK